MKFHRTLVQAVLETLQKIFVEGMYADKAVEYQLKKNSRFGSRDRRFIAETVYEMVRWWRLIKQSGNFQEPSTETDFRNYFAAWQLIKGVDLPEWEEFKEIEKNKILENQEQVKKIRKYRESIPDWLDEIGSKELGEEVWEKELAELNKEAKVVLRVNTLKTSAEELQKKLSIQNIEVALLTNVFPAWIQLKSEGLLVKRQALQQLEEYKLGLFEIQDASSQLVAHFLQPEEGMVVIDACAGAGGKSLHIAALMENKGKIISMDVEEQKLITLKKRADRAGVRIIQTQVIHAGTINKFENTADRLLLDVPCSGLGVIRRNPDAKWKLSLEFISEVKKRQQEIISNYSQMLKPGGIMVYATCSILPGENQNQVEQFLNSQKGKFEFSSDRKVLPSEGFDGFYMCVIKKL